VRSNLKQTLGELGHVLSSLRGRCCDVEGREQQCGSGRPTGYVVVASMRDKLGDDAEAGALPPGTAVREALSLLQPFVAHFGGDEDLAREYAAIIVRGRHDSAIFRGLGESLTAEVEAVLRPAGVSRAEAGARTVYLAYLGILMTASHGAIAEQQALLQLEEVVRFVIDSPETPE
jgi:hypothetical protein